MTSYSHVTSSMTSPIDATCALSYRFPIGHEPQNRLVSEIFSINVTDRQKRPNRAVKTLNGQLNYRDYHHWYSQWIAVILMASWPHHITPNDVLWVCVKVFKRLIKVLALRPFGARCVLAISDVAYSLVSGHGSMAWSWVVSGHTVPMTSIKTTVNECFRYLLRILLAGSEAPDTDYITKTSLVGPKTDCSVALR